MVGRFRHSPGTPRSLAPNQSIENRRGPTPQIRHQDRVFSRNILAFYPHTTHRIALTNILHFCTQDSFLHLIHVSFPATHLVVVGMMIFPPWKYTYEIPHKSKYEQPGKYQLIFTPPSVPVDERYTSSYDGTTSLYFHGLYQHKWTPRVDVNRLLIQCITVSIITIGLILTLKRRSHLKEGE